jgi:hypothetical protein
MVFPFSAMRLRYIRLVLCVTEQAAGVYTLFAQVDVCKNIRIPSLYSSEIDSMAIGDEQDRQTCGTPSLRSASGADCEVSM